MHRRYLDPKVTSSFRWVLILTIRGFLLGFFCDQCGDFSFSIADCCWVEVFFYSHFNCVFQNRGVLQDFSCLAISLWISTDCVVCCLEFRMVWRSLKRRALHIPTLWPYFMKLFNLTHTRKMFALLQEEVLTLNIQPEKHVFSCQQEDAVSGTNICFTSVVVIWALAFAVKRAETPAFLNKSVSGLNIMCWIWTVVEMCIPYLVWCVIFHWSINRACIVLSSLLAYFLICVLKHYRWWHFKTRQCPYSSPLCEHRLDYIMCSTALYSYYGKCIVFSYCFFLFFLK